MQQTSRLAPPGKRSASLCDGLIGPCDDHMSVPQVLVEEDGKGVPVADSHLFRMTGLWARKDFVLSRAYLGPEEALVAFLMRQPHLCTHTLFTLQRVTMQKGLSL